MSDHDENDGRMTGTEFAECVAAIGWSGHELSHRSGVHISTIKRWLSGRGGWIPDDVAAWVRELADFHRSHPPPWRPDGVAPRSHGHRRKQLANSDDSSPSG